MLRIGAVRQLLVEDVCGIRREPGAHEESAADDSLARAQRRATAVIVLDWIAILVLAFARAQAGESLTFGPHESGIFSIGLLAIAIHSGFRMGQLEKYRAASRVLDELTERSGTANTDSDGP